MRKSPFVPALFEISRAFSNIIIQCDFTRSFFPQARQCTILLQNTFYPFSSSTFCSLLLLSSLPKYHKPRSDIFIRGCRLSHPASDPSVHRLTGNFLRRHVGFLRPNTPLTDVDLSGAIIYHQEWPNCLFLNDQPLWSCWALFGYQLPHFELLSRFTYNQLGARQ